jgi:D-alanyl-D-alanine carboxypeptidase (penicillin-binding protein 5/6)
MSRNHSITLGLMALIGLGPLAHAAPPVPAPPQIGAEAHILADAQSGRVLAASNPDQPVEPASITKVMTGYVIYQALADGDIHLDDTVNVSEKAWRAEGSRMFIEPDKPVTLEELLYGMVVQSGNDATIALAEHVAGTEEAFVGYMNYYAEQLGLENTHYTNASGLPNPEHYTSARDIVTLVEALIRRFPQHFERYSTRTYTYNDITQSNRNRLLWRDDSVDGIKTGYTESAGYCLAATAERDGMRLVSVVLGTESPSARAEQSQALLNYGFRFFRTRQVFDAGEKLTERTVWKGAAPDLYLGPEQPLYVTVPKGRAHAIETRFEVPEPIIAPIAQGDPMGQVIVGLEDETLAERPLQALNGVPAGNFAKQLWDSVRLWFE